MKRKKKAMERLGLIGPTGEMLVIDVDPLLGTGCVQRRQWPNL